MRLFELLTYLYEGRREAVYHRNYKKGKASLENNDSVAADYADGVEETLINGGLPSNHHKIRGIKSPRKGKSYQPHMKNGKLYSCGVNSGSGTSGKKSLVMIYAVYPDKVHFLCIGTHSECGTAN